MFLLKSKISWSFSSEKEALVEGNRWKYWEKQCLKLRGKSVHPVRLKHFILARLSFDKLTKKSSLSYNPSYTHTENLGLCAISHSPKYFVGIDIENSKRKMKDNIEKMYSSSNDYKEYSPLQLWCLKEAAFKALSRAFQVKTAFSKIHISKDHFTCQGYTGTCWLEELSINNEHYHVALTILDSDQR